MKAMLLDLVGLEAHRPDDDVPEVRALDGSLRPKRVITWVDGVYVYTPKMREGLMVYHQVHAWHCPDTGEGTRCHDFGGGFAS